MRSDQRNSLLKTAKKPEPVFHASSCHREESLSLVVLQKLQRFKIWKRASLQLTLAKNTRKNNLVDSLEKYYFYRHDVIAKAITNVLSLEKEILKKNIVRRLQQQP